MFNVFAVCGPFVPTNEPMTLIPYKQLRLLDAKIDVFALKYHEDESLKQNIEKDVNYTKFNIKYGGNYDDALFSIKNINLIKALYNKNKYVKEAVKAYYNGKYDVLYTSSFPAYSHQVGLEITKHKEILWIANFTDPINNSPYKYDNKTYKAYSLPEKLAFKAYCHYYVDDQIEIDTIEKADVLIFICQEQKDFMIEQYLKKKGIMNKSQIEAKSVIVPLCYVQEWESSEKPNDLRCESNKVVLSHFGRIYGLRIIEEFIYAVKLLVDNNRDIKPFVIKQFGEFRKSDLELIKKLDLDEYFEIYNKIPYDQCIQAMHTSDVLLVFDTIMHDTNWQPYLPSKLLEYSMVNKNVFAVTTNNSPTYRIFKESNAVCANYDRNEIAKSLLSMINGKESKINYCFENQESIMDLKNTIDVKLALRTNKI